MPALDTCASWPDSEGFVLPELPTVLIVDDEACIAEELALGLTDGGLAVAVASSAARAQAALAADDRIGVVVTDIRMPGEDGLSLARRLVSNRPDSAAVETVVMTGHATIDDAVAAVRASAFDFIRKPFSLDQMTEVVRAACRRAMARRQDAAATEARARRLALAELERAAAEALDPLTGLPNRLGFAACLDSFAAAADPGLAVIVLDIDGFLPLSEAAGGCAGELLLREVARRLREAAGDGWVLARIGRDAFAAAARSCADEAAAFAMAERLRAAIELPVRLPRGCRRITASLGVAHAAMLGRHGLEAAAQVACDAAQRAGGGRSLTCTPTMRQAEERRLAILQALPGAIERGEISLHYQPIFRIADRALLGFEALLRWHHPELGAVPPGEFIAIAEEGRLVLELGAWALRAATRQAAAWREGGQNAPFVSVNLSGRQIELQDVPAMVAAALAEAGLPPAALVVEMTETVALGPWAAEAVAALQRLGVRVALDDFGVGYSSLGVLGRLTVDIVKLDRGLVAGVATEARERRLLDGLVATLHALGTTVLAEGIETEAQLAVAGAAGCVAAQGYLLGRPQPAAQATRLLAPS